MTSRFQGKVVIVTGAAAQYDGSSLVPERALAPRPTSFSRLCGPRARTVWVRFSVGSVTRVLHWGLSFWVRPGPPRQLKGAVLRSDSPMTSMSDARRN